MSVVHQFRIAGIAAVAAGSLCACAWSAEESPPLDDAMLDPIGVLRTPPVEAAPEHPLRKYVGDPFRFDFEESPADEPAVRLLNPIGQEQPFQQAVAEWDQLKVGELPTEEGAIIYGDPALLLTDPAPATQLEQEAAPLRVARWWQIFAASAAAAVLLAGVFWCRRHRLFR
jgi:hypothetical protein